MSSKDNDFNEHAYIFILLIDEVLKSQGKTRYWLSKKTGISGGQLSQYFNLTVIPSLAVFLKMLHALELNFFFETRNSDTILNKEFEKAMDELGRRTNKLKNT